MSEGFDRPFTASEKQSATFWMLLRGTEEGSASRELACMEGEQAMTLEWALNEGMCPEDRRDAYAHVGEFHFESPPWQQERFLGRVEVYLAHSNPLNLPSSPFAWTDAARNERTPLLRLLEQALGEEGGQESDRETASDET